jgi:spore germination protein
MGIAAVLAGLTVTTLSTASGVQLHTGAVAFRTDGQRLGGRSVAHPETGVLQLGATATATVHGARSRAVAAPTAKPAPRPAAAAAPAPALPAREVLGFAPAWTLDTWPSWRMGSLSTVAYFGVTLDGDGNTVADELWPTWQSQELTDMVDAAHRAHDRVLVTVRNFDQDQIESMLSDGNHVATALQTVTDLVRMRRLDGAVIDFEGTADSNDPGLRDQLRQFVAALRAKLSAYQPGSELVVATFGGSGDGDGGMFDLAGLSPFVDAFFVMAYDMSSDNTPGRASATAPLQGGQFNDTTVVQQYLAHTSADKLILGVPYYGYKWSVTSPDPNAAIVSDPQPATYAQMLDDDFHCAQGLAIHAGDATPWATWYSPPDGDPCGANLGTWREVYFDTATTIGAKYDLVNRSNLRGTGMWALGFDNGHTELWDVLASRLRARH